MTVRIEHGDCREVMAVYSLTPAQAHCARIFAELGDVLSRQLTVQEVADELCTSRGNAHVLMGHLQERGWLVKVFETEIGWSLRLTRPPPLLPVYTVEVTPLGQAQLKGAAQ